ncbi:hypothetical protein B7494_g3245 [Chlorociboria aeruginascens]|nr:hypothetical protein B7494_g3245 [Chlorociboria aeruginascens]
MERPNTPPTSITRPEPISPPTPEVTRRIEENRLKAKALRERSLAAERVNESVKRTPSGFIVSDEHSLAGRKRTAASISSTSIPETSRDARNRAPADDTIQAARKFRKYVDHDFSKMTDTRGGFLNVEDDPWNKALHAPSEGEKPAHMTLKEWERHQLLKGLRNRKEGPFEPGLSVLSKVGKKCRECASLEIDWQWEDVFKTCVCNSCKEKFPEKYSLLTKTEAKDDYLLTDPELKDPELLPHLNKPNPHKSHWHDMMLFLRYQVEEYAFNTKWGSAEALDAEFEKREVDKKKRKEDKFKSKLQELKKKTRTEAYRRHATNGGRGEFGDVIGSGKHEHEWGQTIENEDGVSVKTCLAVHISTKHNGTGGSAAFAMAFRILTKSIQKLKNVMMVDEADLSDLIVIIRRIQETRISKSASGMGVGGNGGSNGVDVQNPANQPQGTEYTLQGVMRFLQTEWHRHERDRNAWEIERQEMKGRIARLEGTTRKSDSTQTSLRRYITMLEAALRKRDGQIKERDAQIKAIKAGELIEIKDEKSKLEVLEKKDEIRPTSVKPHNSFLEVEAGNGIKQEDYPDRPNMKGFMDRAQGELTYLMVSPSNPIPPRDPPPPPEDLMSFSAPQGQHSLEEIYQQAARQKMTREPNMSRPSPTPNHHPPPVPLTSNLSIRNPDQPPRSLADQQPLPQTTQEEWSTNFQLPEKPQEEEVTKIRHSYDSYGRQVDIEESPEKAVPTEADGWDFNDAAQYPEQEVKITPQRPDTDLFPIAQDPPKSPVRGPLSHRRKGSMSRKKSAEHDLSLNPTQKPDSGNFKVRFGLRGHLDAVRSVIFSGGGSPGEPELCTAGDDGTIKRWIIPARYENQGGMHNSANDLDIQSYFTHRGHSGSVMCLTSWSPSQNFSSGGRAQGDGWIFSGGQDATVRVWERGRVDPKATLDGHTDAVWTVCVLPGTTGTVFGPTNSYGGPDRILLATGAADGTVRVWSISAPPQLVSPSGGSGRRGGRVRGNSMSSGSAFPSSPQPSIASNSPFHYTLIHTISRANSTASPTCITPLSSSGEAFVVSYSDAAVLAYDTRTGEEVAAMASLETYNGTNSTGVNAIVASTTGLDGSLSFDSSRGLSEDDSVVGGATGTSGGVEGIIISGHEDRFIRFYDANSGQCTYNMLAHPAAISALSLSPDGHELPDIGYAPDLDKYIARTRRRLETEPLPKTLPDGFPQKLSSDLVWEGQDLKNRYEWVYTLNEDQIEEIEEAARHFKSLGKPLGFVTQETFPLPKLHPILRSISRELHSGHGFKVLRGLPVTKHSREENILIYAGVSSHIASQRGRQDNKHAGKPADVVLNHIKDLSATADKDRIGAPAYTTDKQVFHTDAGDIVSLFALSTAAVGGQSKLASSWRVYNELAATRPDLIRTLAEPWVADNFGNKETPYSLKPLLHLQPATATSPERVLLQYARRTFTGFQALPRSTTIPPITEAQAEALDALHFLGERFHVALDFRQGDVQYVNNLSVFHARDAFQDTPEKQRHLIRLWLRDPEYAWPTPDSLADRWAQLYDGVSPEAQVFPLEPRIRSSSEGVVTNGVNIGGSK